MSVTAIIGSIGPVAKVLLKCLELIDPKTRDWVRKRKALEWAEKYMLKDKDLTLLFKGVLSKEELLDVLKDKGMPMKDLAKVAKAWKGKKYYAKWFFDNN